MWFKKTEPATVAVIRHGGLWDNLKELEEWTDKNLKKTWFFSHKHSVLYVLWHDRKPWCITEFHYTDFNVYHFKLLFKRKKDAMRFKLVWG